MVGFEFTLALTYTTDLLSRVKRWALTRTLLLGKYKNPDCLFAQLPVEIIHLVVHFVWLARF